MWTTLDLEWLPADFWIIPGEFWVNPGMSQGLILEWAQDKSWNEVWAEPGMNPGMKPKILVGIGLAFSGLY